ncbi:hypothetical protein [Streptomyces malaysiensis]|uniref:hypothetical protein n=1 Tax=Streptomyces malaysiensis TaxID=92644 RepID=UPI003686D2F0
MSATWAAEVSMYAWAKARGVGGLGALQCLGHLAQHGISGEPVRVQAPDHAEYIGILRGLVGRGVETGAAVSLHHGSGLGHEAAGDARQVGQVHQLHEGVERTQIFLVVAQLAVVRDRHPQSAEAGVRESPDTVDYRHPGSSYCPRNRTPTGAGRRWWQWRRAQAMSGADGTWSWPERSSFSSRTKPPAVGP